MAAEERAAVGPPAAQACQEHGASDHRSIKLPDPVRPLMRGPTAASPTFPPLRRRVVECQKQLFFAWYPNHLPVDGRVAPTPGGDGTLRKHGRFPTFGREFLGH